MTTDSTCWHLVHVWYYWAYGTDISTSLCVFNAFQWSAGLISGEGTTQVGSPPRVGSRGRDNSHTEEGKKYHLVYVVKLADVLATVVASQLSCASASYDDRPPLVHIQSRIGARRLA